MGGSSKKQTVGYEYYMGLFMALCYGPVDRVHKLIAGERDAWVGPLDDSGPITIDKPDLFGGRKREGGIKGAAEIMMGKATQTLSSWARSLLPAPHVGYRGVLTVLYDGLISANSRYMKPWAVRVERVLKGWQDDDCWYPAKAPIPIGVDDLNDALTVSWTLRGLGLPLGSSNVYQFNPAASSPSSQTRTYRSGTGAVDMVQLRVTGEVELRDYPGSTPVVGSVVRGGAVAAGDATNVYTLTISSPAATYRFNRGTWVPTLTEIDETFTVAVADGATVTLSYDTIDDKMIGNLQTLSVSADIAFSVRAMNPAHIIVECLTNSEWGDGWPRAMIGPSFTAAADTLHAEGFGLCLLWNRQGEIWDFIGEICSHIGGVVYQDPHTGLFELRLLRADYDAASLQLIESSPDMVESFQRATYGAMVNEVTVIYRDWKTNTDAGVTVQNGACIAAQGGTVAETKQYPGIPTAELAARVAQRDVIASSTPLARATILCDRSAWAMTPGSVFRWRFLQEGLDGVVMRVLDVDRGELADGVIKLVIAEDVFGLPSASYIGTEPPAWEQPDGAAAPPVRQQLVELPYRSLVSELSAVELVALDDDVAFFGALAARPSNVSLGVELWSRSDGADSYSDQGPGAFVPAAELADAIDRMTATLTLAAGIDLDDVDADEYAVIGTGRAAEWVQVVSFDLATVTATVRRGALDTVPQAWPAGTPVFFDDARSAADFTERATGETVGVKLLTYTSSSTLSIDDGIEISATADQRQARPYPPANVQFNGEYFPVLAETPVTLTWAHRDRTQQTAPAAQAWTDGSIGPEPGVTYSLTVRDASTNGLLYSATGLTGTSTEISSFGGSAEAIITLRSVRAGLECWQPFQHALVFADGVLAAEDSALLAAEDSALLVADQPGTVYVATFSFSGTYAAADAWRVTMRIGGDGVDWSVIEVSALAAGTLAGCALALRDALSVAFPAASVEADGSDVIIQAGQPIEVFRVMPAFLDNVSVVMRQAPKPVTTGAAQNAMVGLYTQVSASTWQACPVNDSALLATGTAVLKVGVFGRTWAAQKALGRGAAGFGTKDIDLSWDVVSPSTYYLTQMAGLVDAAAALASYDISCGMVQIVGSTMDRPWPVFQSAGEYAVSAVGLDPYIGYHPSGYRLLQRQITAGEVPYPSGAKQLTTVAFTLYGTSTVSVGQRYELEIDGTPFVYVATSGDTGVSHVAAGLKALVEAGGTYSVNWLSSLALIEVEHASVNVPFSMSARASYGGHLTVAIE